MASRSRKPTCSHRRAGWQAHGPCVTGRAWSIRGSGSLWIALQKTSGKKKPQSPKRLEVFFFCGISARNWTRTSTPCGIRPSNVRVYQFHHPGILKNQIKRIGATLHSLQELVPGTGPAGRQARTEALSFLKKKLKNLCPGLDSNQHSLRHTPLKRTCLPISPPGLKNSQRFESNPQI